MQLLSCFIILLLCELLNVIWFSRLEIEDDFCSFILILQVFASVGDDSFIFIDALVLSISVEIHRRRRDDVDQSQYTK